MAAESSGTPLFQRSMRRAGTLLITVSAITPAASVFLMGQQVISQAGTGALICFALAAFVSLTTAFVYAELASAFPLTGGEYSIIGRTMGPSWGLMALGLNIFGGFLGQAYMALGLANYLGVLLPGLPALPTALAVTIGTIAISVLNIRTNAVITGLFLMVELLALGILTGLGVTGHQRGVAELVLHPSVVAAGTLAPTSLAVIGSATAVAIFAYNGYGGAVFFGEEMYEARTNLAWVVFASLIVAVVAEALPVVAVLAGATDLRAVLGAASPIPAFLADAGGPWIAKAVSLGVAFAIINALIAIALINARQLYASARDGVWPARLNRAIRALHPRFNSPWIASLIMGALTLAACFLDMNLLGMLTGTGLVAVYAGVSLAAIVGRATGATAQGHYRMPWFPVAPALALVALAGVVWADLADPQNRISLLANVAVMLASAGYYWAFLRRRGGFTLRGADGKPLEELEAEGLGN